MNFFVPGKTFLVGEYSVLLGGAALGLATRPFFEYTYLDDYDMSTDLKNQVTTFHPDSPAGLYLSQHELSSQVIFRDHYAELGVTGGFGRSTAEYFAAMTPHLLTRKKSFFEILKEYKELHSHKKTIPSGIDLAFQFFGDVTLADTKVQFFQNFDWMFLNLDFFVISTGLKVPTHEHLAQLNLDDLQILLPVSDKVIQTYTGNKEGDFLTAMQEWSELLEECSLTHLNSIHLRRELEKNKDIKLVKPCGALGADVLLVFFETEKHDTVKAFLSYKKINIQADSASLTSGLNTQLREYWSQHVD